MMIGVVMMNAQEYNKLTDAEKYVIEQKGTERPFTGIYYNHSENGVYSCKKCDQHLFESSDKFDANCGWPSFDDAIEGAVSEKLDADGRRTEIVCSNCGAHLGHVFRGEGFTDKNVRHCVNSISLNFVPEENKKSEQQRAYFAGGCFWGVEYHFNKLDGVISAVSGFSGGDVKNPTYRDVVSGTTGHAETVEITFNPAKVSYRELAKLFFEIHDPTQLDRQGPDIGEQYRSAIFYTNEEQKNVANELVKILRKKGYDMMTAIVPFEDFYSAEDYHQDYYERKGSVPYCHIYQKKFD